VNVLSPLGEGSHCTGKSDGTRVVAAAAFFSLFESPAICPAPAPLSLSGSYFYLFIFEKKVLVTTTATTTTNGHDGEPLLSCALHHLCPITRGKCGRRRRQRQTYQQVLCLSLFFSFLELLSFSFFLSFVPLFNLSSSREKEREDIDMFHSRHESTGQSDSRRSKLHRLRIKVKLNKLKGKKRRVLRLDSATFSSSTIKDEAILNMDESNQEPMRLHRHLSAYFPASYFHTHTK
jgi:hypothetical protein